ncbi:MAG TPA: hypothetical protein VHK65_17535 [Candidatus Dormibacteraeota bacterium]|nr:hypothetical protein [Candidatus Dormibacteraeota bacterium]
MANYLLAYHGGGGMAQDESARNKLMAQWGKWFQDLGSALVDGGNPVMKAKTITSKGGVSDGGGQNPVSGYSVIKADSLDAAVKLAKGCPVLAGGGSIEVAETFNAM